MATTRANISAALKLNNTAFKKGIGNSQKELNKFSSSVKTMGGILGAAFTGRALVNFTAEASKLAAQMEGVAAAFQRISPSMGFMRELKDATKGTVSELSLMKRAVMASNFKIPMGELASLMAFATKRAQETGESVDYLVNSIVIGIGRKSPLILDNLGISAVELREKLDHVGHSGATVGDVAEAVGKIATEEMKKMGDVTETTAIKYERLNAQITDMKVELGNSANVIISKTLPAITAFIDELGVLGRFIQQFWLGPKGEGLFTAEYDRRMEQDIRDNVGRAIEVAKKVVRDKAKELRASGMSEEGSLRQALADQIFSTLGDLARTPEGPWKDVSRDVLKSLQDWRKEIDKFGAAGEAGAESIANLKAEMDALVKIQESLPRGHKDLKDINARIAEIKETIAEIRGETKEVTKDTREYLTALQELEMAADKGYKKAAEYFAKLAEEGQRIKRVTDAYLYDNDETWGGGVEEWENFIDNAEKTEEIMSDMKDTIKKDLIDSFHALGTAIGETFAGIEGALKQLAITIAANIGYILMIAGLKVLELNPGLGAGLIVAGGLLQIGSGLIKGLGNKSAGETFYSSSDSTVIFKIAGSDLQGVLDRNSSTVKRFT